MSATPVPRGRHAPPLEVRQAVQRERLLRAAADVFARSGYAEASAEAIAREAGMSKATFYEHFSNKEECMLGLFDDVAQRLLERLAASVDGEFPNYRERLRTRVRSFIEAISDEPNAARAILVDIIGAGPSAAERRDAMLDLITDAVYRDNHEAAPAYGAPRYVSRDDAFLCVGAVAEILGRHLRTGQPEDPLELVPAIERLFFGVLEHGAR
ncbi:TetR/AcrR family transcriptional regulator [Conexibacter sp. SYSU D00693]|uniref:TetR/AcrR family transcriptional regulator n=1 Tax=Conexibacter sp. SYSU D00693 TaxID=2812560 RepID=UPI00196A7076|nr:TetR/AcrR family transcriptional regulator [Conexibacter sp. SYSU D00693]